MVRPALYVPDAIAAQFLLEIGRAAPGRVLPALVGEDLPWRTVVGNPSGQGLHHQRALLVVRHRQAHQIPRVIVQKRRHVHPLVLAQQESEEIRLPELVWLGTLKAMLLGLWLRLGRLALPRHPLRLQHPAHRRLRRANPEETRHHVANPPAASLRLLPLHRHDRLAPGVPFRLRSRALGPRMLQRLHATRAIGLHPVDRSRVGHPKPRRRLMRADALVHYRPRQCQPNIHRPCPATRLACLRPSLHLPPP